MPTRWALDILVQVLLFTLVFSLSPLQIQRDEQAIEAMMHPEVYIPKAGFRRSYTPTLPNATTFPIGKHFETYYVSIEIGTPPRTYRMMPDTGKTTSWALAESCADEGTSQYERLYTNSSTYRSTRKKKTELWVIDGNFIKSKGKKHPGQIKGKLITETMYIPSKDNGYVVPLTPMFAVTHTKDMYSTQRFFAEGVWGLGGKKERPPKTKKIYKWFWDHVRRLRRTISRTRQKRVKNRARKQLSQDGDRLKQRIFAMVLHNDAGFMQVGGYDDRFYYPPIRWFPRSDSVTTWELPRIRDILVGDNSTGYCTGSSGCHLAVHNAAPMNSGPQDYILDLTTRLLVPPACVGITDMPNITFMLEGNETIVFSMSDYIDVKNYEAGSQQCVFNFATQGTGKQYKNRRTFILGAPFIQRYFTIFDDNKGKIGIARKNPEYWEGPIASSDTNATDDHYNSSNDRGDESDAFGLSAFLGPVSSGLPSSKSIDVSDLTDSTSSSVEVIEADPDPVVERLLSPLKKSLTESRQARDDNAIVSRAQSDQMKRDEKLTEVLDGDTTKWENLQNATLDELKSAWDMMSTRGFLGEEAIGSILESWLAEARALSESSMFRNMEICLVSELPKAKRTLLPDMILSPGDETGVRWDDFIRSYKQIEYVAMMMIQRCRDNDPEAYHPQYSDAKRIQEYPRAIIRSIHNEFNTGNGKFSAIQIQHILRLLLHQAIQASTVENYLIVAECIKLHIPRAATLLFDSFSENDLNSFEHALELIQGTAKDLMVECAQKNALLTESW